jgi:carbonic anhydrase/acetyltransferase-like protein (isoleucine patch superfamily)
MLSSDITEYDMVTLEDEAVINTHAGPQTHLFEDRVMKVGTVHLEKRAVMKPNSICLPNSRIGANGQLGTLSLLMKGESVPANQAWEGAPIAPRKNRKRSPFVQEKISMPTKNESAFTSQSTLFLVRPRGDGSRSVSTNTAKTIVAIGESLSLPWAKEEA